ncbi:DNA primase, partial [Patescibacteria group bacterium]|nr:DNA primase [Patescibacteria group bacterium]
MTSSDAEKIKEAIDIVSFIGRYVKLKHVGRNFQGLCPFHQDTSPSFTVSA